MTKAFIHPEIDMSEEELRSILINTKISVKELELFKLPDRYPAMEVANRIQLQSGANVLDKLDLELTPYLIDPVSLIGDARVEWLIIIAPTQSGKTVFLQIVVADSIDQDPGTMIYVLPDQNNGRKALKEKVIGMIKRTPSLMAHCEHEKKLNLTSIELDNMTIYPGWSNSPGTVSSTPAKRVIADEVRLFNLEIKGEANALKQMNDRLTTYLKFGQGQGYAVSSAGTEGDLLHRQTKIKGTVNLFWHIKCKNKDCGRYFLPDFFTHLNFKRTCTCDSCGYEFSDADFKKEYNRLACYAPKDWTKDEPRYEKSNIEDYLAKRMCFHYCSLSSPFRDFKTILSEYLETKDKIFDYKNFVMCWLARFWKVDLSKTSTEMFEEKKVKGLKRGTVPENTMFLTAGVDSQGYGFNVEVAAWFYGGESVIIDEFVISCSSKTSNVDQVEELFKTYLEEKVYLTENKAPWELAMWSIDTGGDRTREVYDATAGLPKCVRVKGAGPTQATVINYNQKLDLYLVRTGVYAQETEDASMLDGWKVHEDISDTYITEFVNYRKGEKVNAVTNESQTVWVKVGKNDYRMSCIHRYICLDISIDGFTLRNKLTENGFTYNPYINALIAESEDLKEAEKSQPRNLGKSKKKQVTKEPETIEDIPDYTEDSVEYEDYVSDDDNEYDVESVWD